MTTSLVAYTLELLHLSDQEASTGAFVDAPALSAVVNALRAQDLFNDGNVDNTLFLSSGDVFIPSSFYSASQSVYGFVGIGDILIQNAMGLQASALGNHEFDSGTQNLARLVGGDVTVNFTGTNFPYLSCNLNFAQDTFMNPLQTPRYQAPLARKITSSVVFTVGGEKIGVVGATTPTLRTISSTGDVTTFPVPFAGSPSGAEVSALAAIIQAEVDGLIAANAGMNKVILLAHMQSISIEFELAQKLRNVDIIVAGGSNTRLFDANDRVRAGDSKQGTYPTFFNDLEGKPVAVINTDGSYKYVGRLVIGFDASGNLIPSTYDVAVSGAYATDAQGVADLNSTGAALVDPVVADVTKRLEERVTVAEGNVGNVLGFSDVFLNGNRGALNDPILTDGVRTQETNLGDLSADANLWYARLYEPSVTISLKNGGGIRANIGVTVVPAGSTSFVRSKNEEILLSNGTVLKPAGGISQNDVATALAFNNNLSVVSVNKTALKSIMEYGISGLRGPQARMCQVGGIRFTFNSSAPVNSRIINLDITSVSQPIPVVLFGTIVGNAGDLFRMVVINFLLPGLSSTNDFGGDGYVIPVTGRVTLSALLDGDPGKSNFAPSGSEQDAMAEFLLQFHNMSTPYSQVDTDRLGDQRLVDVSFFPTTKAPTELPVPVPAPVTSTPTATPVTSTPTAAPVTLTPTAAPVTSTPTAAPTKAPINCDVVYQLFNSQTEQFVANLLNGTTLTTPPLPPCKRTNIEAVVPCGDTDDRVVIELFSGSKRIRRHVESTAPYFLFANSGTNVFDGKIAPGTYRIRTQVNNVFTPFTTFTLQGPKCS